MTVEYTGTRSGCSANTMSLVSWQSDTVYTCRAVALATSDHLLGAPSVYYTIPITSATPRTSYSQECLIAWTTVVLRCVLILVLGVAFLTLSGLAVCSVSDVDNTECGLEALIQSRIPFSTQWLLVGVTFMIFDTELCVLVLVRVALTSWVASLVISGVILFIAVTLFLELCVCKLYWVS